MCDKSSNVSPTRWHLNSINKILKYIKYSQGRGLMFHKTKQKKNIQGDTNSAWVGGEDNKSTSRLRKVMGKFSHLTKSKNKH